MNIHFYDFYNLYGNAKKIFFHIYTQYDSKNIGWSHRVFLWNLPYGIVPVCFKWLQSIRWSRNMGVDIRICDSMPIIITRYIGPAKFPT